MNAMLNAKAANMQQYQQGLGGGLDLRTANAGQLQDAARRRHGELAEKAKKLEHELRALTEEMVELATMFPKQEVTT